MNMKNIVRETWRLAICLALASVGWVSCQQKNTFAIGPVSYVNSFPKSVVLEADSTISYDSLAVELFWVYDTMMVVQTADQVGAWKVVSLNDYKVVREYFSKGHAFGEFTNIPACCRATYSKVNDSIQAVVYNWSEGAPYKVNLSADDDGAHSSTQKIELEPLGYVDGYIYLSDDSYIARLLAFRKDQPKEFVYVRGGQKVDYEPFRLLNNLDVTGVKDQVNVLMAMATYNRKHNKVVVTHMLSNTLTILSLDDEKDYRSICLGDRLITIEEAGEQLVNYEVGPKLTVCNSGDDFFAVMSHTDPDYDDFMTFDYEGNPLCRYRMEKKMNAAYQIDVLHHCIYCLDPQTSLIQRYTY